MRTAEPTAEPGVPAVRSLADLGPPPPPSSAAWVPYDLALGLLVAIALGIVLRDETQLWPPTWLAIAAIGGAVAIRSRNGTVSLAAVAISIALVGFDSEAANSLTAVVIVWLIMTIASEGRLGATVFGCVVYAGLLFLGVRAGGLGLRTALLYLLQSQVLIVAMLRFAFDERAGYEAERRAVMTAAEAELRHRRAEERDRQRISLELHGIVSDAMQRVRASTERPDAVTDQDLVPALTAAEEASRAALAELRRMVRVLRTEDGAAERRPQPGLTDVEELLRTAAPSATISVDVHTATGGAPTLSMAIYRLVEDALEFLRGTDGSTLSAATVRRLGDHVHVRMEGVDVGTTEMRLGYPNTVAMRERVQLVGGHIDIAPGPGGDGVVIDATFPLSRP